MAGNGLAYTFTDGIRAGVCVSPFPRFLIIESAKGADILLGYGHRRSSLGLNNISPNSPPCPCCLHSDRLQPPIPPLEDTSCG